jgi:hypothetical protein
LFRGYKLLIYNGCFIRWGNLWLANIDEAIEVVRLFEDFAGAGVGEAVGEERME